MQKAGLDAHDISLSNGSADVLSYEVSPANAYCSGTGKRISHIRLVARTVSSRRRNSGRAMELVKVTSLSWRSAIVVLSHSLMQVSCSRGRDGQLCVWNKEHFGRIQCLLRSDWRLRWLDVCICTDASEEGFAFAVREGCRELASEVGRVSERTRFKSSSRSIRWSVQVRTRVRCRLPEGRVARTSQKCRCNFWLPRNGSWRRAVGVFREETSWFSKHVPSCVPSGVQRVTIRRDAS